MGTLFTSMFWCCVESTEHELKRACNKCPTCKIDKQEKLSLDNDDNINLTFKRT